jgi:F-type H+-transporting ATPase subunit delta
MKNRVLVKRYAQGLINASKSENEFKVIYRNLLDFHALLKKYKNLKSHLYSPFLPLSKKIRIAEGILNEGAADKKASRLILLLIENDRLQIFPDILELLPELWDEEKGISTFEVSSVVPLSDLQKKNLSKKLEGMENTPVSLKFKVDHTLVGGIAVRKGNIIYDISIKGQILKLKENIIEG